MFVRQRIYGSGPLILACALVGVAWGQPKLEFAQHRWDFGEIYHPQEVFFALKVTNTGNEVLRIADPKPSCGCTAAEPEKNVLAPGESTMIRVSYDSKGRRDRINEQVKVRSNDPEHPERVFHVTGTVKHAIDMDPLHGVYVRMLDMDEVKSREVILENNESTPMKPKLDTRQSGNFRAELEEIEAGRKYKITISTVPPAPSRNFSGKFTVETGLELAPELEVHARAQVVDRVNVLPPSQFVKLPIQEMTHRSYRIEYFGEDPNFRVTRAICDDPSVRVSVVPARGNQRMSRTGLAPNETYRVVAAIPPGTQVPEEGIALRIYTTDPAYPELAAFLTSSVEMHKYIYQRARETSQRRPQR